MRAKEILWHILVGIIVPCVLIAIVFLVPEPYSHPLINLGLAPLKLMPFIENRETMRVLTEFIFGRMTPNFAPIQLVFLIIFWFIISLLSSIFVSFVVKARK